MSFRNADVLYAAGGDIWEKYGTFVWRTLPGEEPSHDFTRGSGNATFRARTGGMRTAESGVLRPDWVPSLSAYAILLEPASTNEFTQAKALDHADWSKANITVNADQATGPDGATSLEELVEDSTDGNHQVFHTISGMTADATYVLSAFGIAGDRDWIRLRFQEDGNSVNHVLAFYDLANASTGTTGSGGTGSFADAYLEDWTHVASGLHRAVLVGSVGNSATSIDAVLNMAAGDGNNLYAGDGSSALNLGFAQLEDDSAAEAATNFMASGSSTASRNGDEFFVRPGPYFQSITQVYYASYISGTQLGNTDVAANTIWHGDSNNPRAFLDQAGGTPGQVRFRFRDVSGNGSLQTVDVGSADPLQRIEVVYAFDPTDGSVRLIARSDGGTVQDSGQSTPSSWTTPPDLGSQDQITYNEGAALGGADRSRTFMHRHYGVRGDALTNDPLTGSSVSVMDELAGHTV